MKTILTLTFFIFTLTFFSQEKYEYMGAIKLNGDSKALISYRLVFTENKGVIDGYSVTDLGGEHETKNAISGTYNTKTKEFVFKEEDILYTKSTISDDMFCFVNFAGKVKLVNENSVMNGAFKGLFKNKQKCIDGTLTLVGSAKIYKLVNKVNKKLQKSKKVTTEYKKKFNPVTLLDSLKVNNLVKGQNLNIFASSENVELEIWDDGKEDGDIIDVYQNDKMLLHSLKVTKEKKLIPVKLTAANVFKIVATSEGAIAPNTAFVVIRDGQRSFEVISNLKKGEEASITILRKKN